MVRWVIESQRRRSLMGHMAWLKGKDFGREPEGKRPLDGRMVLKWILNRLEGYGLDLIGSRYG
jgi:hypothetical protein